MGLVDEFKKKRIQGIHKVVAVFSSFKVVEVTDLNQEITISELNQKKKKKLCLS
jgi:hypothetical protein